MRLTMSSELNYLEEEINHATTVSDNDFIDSMSSSEIRSLLRSLKKEKNSKELQIHKLQVKRFKDRTVLGKLTHSAAIEKIKSELEPIQASIKKLERKISINNTQNSDNKINDSDIQRAREYPIANIADRHCDLISAGVNRMKAKCPFHVEKTPSFVLYLDNNTYHCFGCSEHGDNIDLYMKLDNADFIQAVRFLSFKS